MHNDLHPATGFCLYDSWGNVLQMYGECGVSTQHVEAMDKQVSVKEDIGDVVHKLHHQIAYEQILNDKLNPNDQCQMA